MRVVAIKKPQWGGPTAHTSPPAIFLFFLATSCLPSSHVQGLRRLLHTTDRSTNETGTGGHHCHPKERKHIIIASVDEGVERDKGVWPKDGEASRMYGGTSVVLTGPWRKGKCHPHGPGGGGTFNDTNDSHREAPFL